MLILKENMNGQYLEKNKKYSIKKSTTSPIKYTQMKSSSLIKVF